MNRFTSLCDRLQSRFPEMVSHAPPQIRDYGSLPYFQPCRIGRRGTAASPDVIDTLNGQMMCTVQASLPRESIGTPSQDIPLSNFQWLLNKRFTCVLMWFGVICLIVGVIALQIASFFKHTRQDILSTGVGCLSASFCLLMVSMFIFLHAYLIIYDLDEDGPRRDPRGPSIKLSAVETQQPSHHDDDEELHVGVDSTNREVV